MSRTTAAKERVYKEALSLLLSLPCEYWVRARVDLDKASASIIPTHKSPYIDEILLGDKKVK